MKRHVDEHIKERKSSRHYVIKTVFHQDVRRDRARFSLSTARWK